MTRDEWRSLHHAIRADARAFKAAYGGYPSFGQTIRHNGVEWTLRRTYVEPQQGIPAHWQTALYTSRLARRPRNSMPLAFLDELTDWRRLWRIRSWPSARAIIKDGMRASIEAARDWRLREPIAA